MAKDIKNQGFLESPRGPKGSQREIVRKCIVCGEKVVDPDRTFCPNCGSTLLHQKLSKKKKDKITP